MTEQLKESKHSKTSIAEFIHLELLNIILSNWLHAEFEASKESIVVSGTDQEEDLQPSKSRDGINGSNTIGDFRAWKTRGNVEWETVGFRGNVSQHSQHAHTSVLEFGSTVGVEGFLINVGGKAKGICRGKY